jgi:hypothetical protein
MIAICFPWRRFPCFECVDNDSSGTTAVMFLRTADVYPHVLVDHVAQLVGLGFWHMNSTQVSFACEHGYHSQFSLKFAGQVQIPASRIRDEVVSSRLIALAIFALGYRIVITRSSSHRIGRQASFVL